MTVVTVVAPGPMGAAIAQRLGVYGVETLTAFLAGP
jgi:hypothetical protein